MEPILDYGRASDLMQTAGIDVLLASSRHNVAYLADYWYSATDEYYVLWDLSATHKTLVGVPRDQNAGPFLVPGASERTALEALDPWIKERYYWGPGFYIENWTELDPDPGNPMDVAARVLAEKGLARGCIAVEMRYLGVGYFERLRARLPQARFVDAEPLLWSLRMVKTPKEIRRTREACRRSARVWRNVIKQAHAGLTEKQMQGLFVQAFAAEGMEFERTFCIFGPAGQMLKNGTPLPSDTALKEGMFIRTDVQGRFEGYMCNLSRVVAFGRVTPAMERAHAPVKGMVDRLVEFLRPGLSCAQVREFELELYRGTGYRAVVPYTGHGVGRVVHEPPYLLKRDPTVLAPGMIVTVEPTVRFSEGGDIFVSLEEQLLITETGCENLTADASLDLYLL